MIIKLGVPEKMDISNRYVEFNRSNAIRDVYDALVELITNCDDSYHHLFNGNKRNEDGGPILIEIKEQRKGQPSLLVIKDRAEGMTLEVMIRKLKRMGERTSLDSDRGFMARGLRDCTELGNIKVESIVDEKYFSCELTRNPMEFIPRNNGDKANELLRKKLGITKRNGTAITIELSAHVRVPRIDTLIRDLAWHYALRDILSEKSASKVELKDLNKIDSKLEKVIWNQPEGELVYNDSFFIPEYPLAECRLTLWKSNEILDDSKGDRFRKSGLLIKGIGQFTNAA